ncbi:MAG: VanZ family protein [Clostridia bacterium]|nr:VanZ family protein [Clostridia bacterium]MBQ6677590.1 VanZ family protein [Clostridia bacterium]
MRNKTVKTVLFILFVIYCAALAFVLFFPNLHRYSHGSRLYNIIPFATVSELIGRLIEGTINADIVVRNIGVNILLFVPMGAFLPVLFKKLRKFRWVILVCFSATVAAELIQFIFILGSFDVDDIILNTAGAAAGYGIVNIPALKKLLY